MSEPVATRAATRKRERDGGGNAVVVTCDWREVAVPEHLKERIFFIERTGNARPPPPRSPARDGREWRAVVHVLWDLSERAPGRMERIHATLSSMGVCFAHFLSRCLVGELATEMHVQDDGYVVWFAVNDSDQVIPFDVTHWDVGPGVAVCELPSVRQLTRDASLRDALHAASAALDAASGAIPEGLYVDLCRCVMGVHKAALAVPSLADRPPLRPFEIVPGSRGHRDAAAAAGP